MLLVITILLNFSCFPLAKSVKYLRATYGFIMKRLISYKQQRFLDFIQRYTIENNQAPSYEDIMDALGFSSLGTVHWYVKTLSDDGYIHRARGPNGKRALILSEEHAVPTVLPLLGMIDDCRR
ncbi:MAG: hypothetical protein GWP19_13345 [Planctomycetia bacterium]|nr:hypothetical protein [Planctomycetia bacterium]